MGLFDRFSKKDSPAATEAAGEATSDASNPGGTSIFGRVRAGLRRTSQLLNTDIRDLFKQDGQLVDDEMLDRLYAGLVKTDMGAASAR
ncbi:MAG: hypothetical protein KDA92_18390, partial [Planctomycetales bacterium]|nr:hypothetical protein [Planctomycetales bacterium]